MIVHVSTPYYKDAKGAVMSVDGFEIQYGKESEYKDAQIYSFTKNKLTVNFKRIVTSFKARIRAYKFVNGKRFYSEWKDSALDSVTVPSYTSASSLSGSSTKDSVTLKWKASGKEYLVYRYSGNWNLLKTTTSTSYTDSKLASNTSYKYVVLAKNEVSTSLPEDYHVSSKVTEDDKALTVKTKQGLSKPSIKKLKLKKGKLTVIWAADSFATGYKIQVSKSKSFKKMVAAKQLKKTSYTVSNLSPEVTYYVRVYKYQTSNGKTIWSDPIVKKISYKRSKTPSTPKIKVTASGTKLAVKVNPGKLDVNGFEIEWAKDFLWLTSNKKTVSKKKPNYTVSVKDPAQYYVRVRSYTIVKGKKYFSKYRTHKCTQYGTRTLPYKAMTGTSWSTCIQGAVHQGACVDPKGNVYMAFMRKYKENKEGTISKGSHVQILKLNNKFKKVKWSKDIPLGHTNGLCYDTKRNRIIATRAGEDDIYVDIINPNTFKCSYKKVSGVKGITAFNDVSYDSRTDTFILHARKPNDNKVVITDANFKVLKSYTNSTPLQQGSTTYSTTLNDKYGHQYYIQVKSYHQTTDNKIRIHDIRNNKLMQTLRLPYKCEVESVWVYKNHLYCSVHKHFMVNGVERGGAIIFRL